MLFWTVVLNRACAERVIKTIFRTFHGAVSNPSMKTVDILPHDDFLQYKMNISTLGPPLTGDVSIFGCRQKDILVEIQ
jgi:hypothetical protein